MKQLSGSLSGGKAVHPELGRSYRVWMVIFDTGVWIEYRGTLSELKYKPMTVIFSICGNSK